jgi:3',5'-cyclic AMP phosphodiesterase CpdA
MTRRVTRRRVLVESASGALGLGLALAGCGGGGAGRAPALSGSTRDSTWTDPVGDGQLRVTAGEPLTDRVELGARTRVTGALATFAHITDAHVLDASSPARVTFLDRLGAPFQSTFRPQEALTVRVLAGFGPVVRALGAGFVVQGGDLIDNDQANELAHAFAALRGGRVSPGSGPHGYDGVQSASDTDPFYYRPALDAPRHPRLLADAVAPFQAPGVGVAVHPVLGDHDALVAGELVPTPLTRSLAVGDRALWDLPTGLTLPPGLRASAVASPDGPPNPGVVSTFLRHALAGPTVRVGADPARRELSFAEVLAQLRAHAAHPTGRERVTHGRLDYVLDVGPRLRLVVLDLVRRAGGSGGLVAAGQPDWLRRRLRESGDRWVIVVTHQPIASSAGGDALLAAMDAAPRVIAALSGHTHRNAISPRRTAAGGYWLISTASLIDYPQQARALAVHTTAGGGAAIETWMLDHVDHGGVGRVARQLAYIDAQGGRPEGFAGARSDRNVTLFRDPPRV